MKNFYGIHVIHRGSYSYKYPENSIPAFRESLGKNKPIELDVHVLKDDVVVVFHDDNLKRMCNSDKRVKDLTSDELSGFKLKNTIYSIPTLKEVLDLVGGHVLLDIELKYDVTDGRLEREVINLLRNYNGEVILKSFDPRIVRNLKKLRRKFKMSFKIGLLSHKSWHLFLSMLISNPNFISYSFKNYNKFLFKFFSKFKPTLLYTFKCKDDFDSVDNFDGGYIVENYDEVFK